MKIRFGLAIFFSICGSTIAEAADTPLGPQKVAILTTITEAVLATVSQIQDENGGSLESVQCAADYSNRDWRLRISGADSTSQRIEI